jgi:hypothetical protein
VRWLTLHPTTQPSTRPAAPTVHGPAEQRP